MPTDTSDKVPRQLARLHLDMGLDGHKSSATVLEIALAWWERELEQWKYWTVSLNIDL